LTETDLQKARQGVRVRLRKARTARGLTQNELGKLAGFNQTVVQNIEDGILWHPSVTSGLAVAMDVSPAWVQWGEPFANKRVV
jgi:DNA-binding XRE family transcriptional regulator